MLPMKYSIILGFLGRLNDRFSSYGISRDLENKFHLASKISGLRGLELVYPFDFSDPAQTKQLLNQFKFECSTVNVNLKAEEKFHHGALTSRDPGIRREAVDYLRNGMNIAADLGAHMITMCPLADGFDYAFESDYLKSWQWFLDGVGEAASSRPEVKVSLEYKQSEPRHKVIIPNAGTTLAACLQIGLPNVGVTMDMGHALYAGESSAQSVSLLAQAGRLFLVHINDNYRNWDWDMIPGSVNPWDLIEMVYYLQRINYSGWFTSDVAPFRLDGVKTLSATHNSLLWAQKMLEKIGQDEVGRILNEGDPIDLLAKLQAFSLNA